MPSTDRNWAAERVRSNFRIDAFSGLMAGIYLGVTVAFLPVVVRRMGGSTEDVALVVAGPFIGHLFSPLFGYLLARFRPVTITAVTATLSRSIFLVGVLVAATPFALAFVSVTMWIIAVANMASYATLMQGIYPDSERASAMGKVRIGASIASIASATLAGLFIDSVPATFVFAAAALLSLPGAIAFGRIRHDPPAVLPVRHRPSHIARDVWRDHRYRRLLVSFTIFGFGNLMNAAIYPILLVDHFNAPNSFVGFMTALQAGSAIIAYFVWGRFIDRGSSLRMTVINTSLVLLMPLGYLVAPSTMFLIPVAIVAGITNAGGDITFFTNIVQLAPPGRIGDYAVAQSSLMGVRGTIAPFAASALLVAFPAQTVMVFAMGLMVAGLVVMDRAVRLATVQPSRVLEAVPA
ncbi:MAG: MFS transporter [Chloroflexota bacterium]|nr:MFS transporter [Chloroflexota bacterium]